MHYFAYGSNMNLDDLASWCNGRGLTPVEPELCEVGTLQGHKLIFNHYAESRDGGALNIIRDSGNKVWGVLFSLSGEDFTKIKMKEGKDYKPLSTTIHLSNRTVGAKVFKADQTLRPLYPPTLKYLDVVVKGARRFDLPEEGIEDIKDAAVLAVNVQAEDLIRRLRRV